jgi:BMFP domain-containing protein YqiC
VEEASAAVPPSPATETSSDSELQRLKAKLDLVTQDKLRAGEKNAQLNNKVQELEDQLRGLTAKLKTGEQKELESTGEYRQLWEQSKETNKTLERRITELENELDAERQARRTETLRTKALQQISEAKALRPDQMLSLLQPNLREVDGAPVVLEGGMEIPLADHLARLRDAESGWDHHFAPSGAKGMGTTPTLSGTGSSYGKANPFRPETRNLTEQSRLFREDPALFERLKAEAQRG